MPQLVVAQARTAWRIMGLAGRERVMGAEASDAPTTSRGRSKPLSGAYIRWRDGWRCQPTFASQGVQAARAPPRKRNLTGLMTRAGRGNGTLSVGARRGWQGQRWARGPRSASCAGIAPVMQGGLRPLAPVRNNEMGPRLQAASSQR